VSEGHNRFSGKAKEDFSYLINEKFVIFFESGSRDNRNKKRVIFVGNETRFGKNSKPKKFPVYLRSRAKRTG